MAMRSPFLARSTRGASVPSMRTGTANFTDSAWRSIAAKSKTTASDVARSGRLLRQSAKRDGVRSVAFGHAALGDHLIANGDAGRIAMVRVLALIEHAINGHVVGRTGTGYRI